MLIPRNIILSPGAKDAARHIYQSERMLAALDQKELRVRFQ